MKFRSALLFVFMLAVPAAAMFSHRIPADLRKAIRLQASRITAALVPAPAQPPASVQARAPEQPPASGADVAVSGSPVARPLAPEGNSTAAVAPPRALPAPPPSAALAVGPGVGGFATDARLDSLGVVGFECRPVAGGQGGHVATGQVPLDASGQLLRVFQATGADPPSATAALVAEVSAWRQRAGASRSATAPTAASTRRF